MFVSKTTLGVEIALPGAAQGASEPNITVGFKTFDAAYVPVVVGADPAKSVSVTSSNRTFNPSTGGEPAAVTQDNQSAITPAAAGPESSIIGRVQQPMSINKNLDSLTLAMKAASDAMGATIQKQSSTTDPQQKERLAKEQAEQMSIFERLAKTFERLTDEKADALSVFSVIDANAWGRSSDAKIGIGKIFATGVAAQKVADRYQTPYSACSAEFIKASAALDIKDGDQKQKLIESLAILCPERKRPE